MGSEFAVQLAASGLALGLLVFLAGWAKLAKPGPPLSETRVREILAEQFPDRVVERVWVAVNGTGALAKSGASALVLCRLGDGFVGRRIPWAQAVCSSFRNGLLSVDLADISAPCTVLALPSWPPNNLAA